MIVGFVLLGGCAIVLTLTGYLIRKRVVKPTPPPRLDTLILELRAHQETLRRVTTTAQAQRAALEPSDAERLERLQLEADVRTRKHL